MSGADDVALPASVTAVRVPPERPSGASATSPRRSNAARQCNAAVQRGGAQHAIGPGDRVLDDRCVTVEHEDAPQRYFTRRARTRSLRIALGRRLAAPQPD